MNMFYNSNIYLVVLGRVLILSVSARWSYGFSALPTDLFFCISARWIHGFSDGWRRISHKNQTLLWIACVMSLSWYKEVSQLSGNPIRGTKECRKGQHWLGLQKLLTCCFEPIKGLCTDIGPIRSLEASIWSMFICFELIKVPPDWHPGSSLGTTLTPFNAEIYHKCCP